MSGVDDSILVEWLGHCGVSNQHIEFLLKKDKIRKRNNQRRHLIPDEFRVQHHVIAGVECIARMVDEDLPILETFRRSIEEGAVALAFRDYQDVVKYVAEKLTIINIARLIYPFEPGGDFLNEVIEIKDKVVDGEFEVFLYPWQNSQFLHAHLCKPKIGDNRRMHYSELDFDFQKEAILHIDDYEKCYPDEAKVWRSYLNRMSPELPSVPPPDHTPQPLETTVNRDDWNESFFQDVAGEYAEILKAADTAFRKKFEKQHSPWSLFIGMPELCPDTVTGIVDDKGEGRKEDMKIMFKGGGYLYWKPYRKVFKRHFPELP